MSNDLNGIRCQILNVTPRMAETWLSQNLYENQRPLNARHVGYLEYEMEKGYFKKATSIEFNKLAGHEILIDGQHRLAAIIESGVSSPMIKVVVDVQSAKEVALNYSYTDINKGRYWSDVIRALGRDEFDLSMTQVNAFKAGLGIVYQGFMKSTMRMSNVTLFDQAKDWFPYAKQYFDTIEGGSSSVVRKMQRRDFIAVALATIRFATDKNPLSFWYQVAVGAGIQSKDPSYRLRDLIIASQLQNNNRRSANITAKELMLLTIKSWNLFSEGRTIGKLVLPRKTQPIKYTPFDFSRTSMEYRICFEQSNWGNG